MPDTGWSKVGKWPTVLTLEVVMQHFAINSWIFKLKLLQSVKTTIRKSAVHSTAREPAPELYKHYRG